MITIVRRALYPVHLILLLSLSIAAFGAPRDRNRVQTLGGPNGDRFHALVNSDGALFFGGLKDGVGGAGEAWLYATDLDGNPFVDRTYRDVSGQPTVIRSLETVRKGLLAGGQLGSGDLDLDVFVMRLTEDGQIVWQVSLELAGNQVLGDLLELANGDVLIVGATLPPGETRSDAWVVRLDPTGAILWQKVLGTPGEDELHTAIETSSGDLLLAGQGGVERKIDGYQGWVVSMDADGSVLSHRGYKLGESDRINKLIATKRGYLGFGVAFETSFQQGQGWVLELDAAADFVDSRLVGDFEQLGHDELLDGVETNAGGFIAVGNTETASGYGQRFLAVEFDSRGVFLWVRHFGADGFAVAAGAVGLRGGRDLVMAGSTQSLGAIDALQVKTVTSPDGGASCDGIGALPIRVVPFLPQQDIPFLTVGDSVATSVAADLTEDSTETARDTLCSF
jgi:hypothetical protein